MAHVKVVVLSDEARTELEFHHRNHSSTAVRQRCQIVLLKSKGRSAEDISAIVDCCPASVHSWVRRYNKDGFSGLLTKPGRGRKPMLSKDKDAAFLLQCVREHRQNLKAAKAAFEAGGGPAVSQDSLRHFLKALVTPIKGYED